MSNKTENWKGHEIRFVEINPGEWWAVAVDVAMVLGYSRARNMIRMLPDTQKGAHLMSTPGGEQELTIISEFGIYTSIMRSQRKEAIAFQDWVYEVIKILRQSTGMEGFQVFRMLDKEHQREAMSRLKVGLSNPVRVDFIKANTIANKAVSSTHGYPKMLKKAAMSPEMLIKRQQILDETVDLMAVNENFKLGLSVSKVVYSKYQY